MLINKPPVLARQLDRCEVCGDKFQKSSLVRTQVEFLDESAQNIFLQSSYDGSYWVCDAVDEGEISIGNRADSARTVLNPDNTISLLNGVQTWSGNGTFRQDTNSINISGNWLTVSAIVGPYERSTTPSMVVKMGTCDTDGNNKTQHSSFSIKTMTRVWFSVEYDSLAGSQDFVYIDVTNSGEWFVDELQYEIYSGSTSPGKFVRSSGTAVALYNDRSSTTTRKVCPDCFETVLSKSEQYGRTDESPTEDPIDTFNQEF